MRIWIRVPGVITLVLAGVLVATLLVGAADIEDRDRSSDDTTEMDGGGHGPGDRTQRDGGDHGSNDDTERTGRDRGHGD